MIPIYLSKEHELEDRIKTLEQQNRQMHMAIAYLNAITEVLIDAHWNTESDAALEVVKLYEDTVGQFIKNAPLPPSKR